MKEYGKIRNDGSIQLIGNPCTVTIANPTEEQKAIMAQLTGDLEVQYTAQPEYNPETQYVTDEFVPVGGKAVQIWTVHEIEPIEEV